MNVELMENTKDAHLTFWGYIRVKKPNELDYLGWRGLECSGKPYVH